MPTASSRRPEAETKSGSRGGGTTGVEEARGKSLKDRFSSRNEAPKTTTTIDDRGARNLDGGGSPLLKKKGSFSLGKAPKTIYLRPKTQRCEAILKDKAVSSKTHCNA